MRFLLLVSSIFCDACKIICAMQYYGTTKGNPMPKSTLVSRAYEARRKSIHSLYAKGWSMQRIADRWQITRERVRQILMIKD